MTHSERTRKGLFPSLLLYATWLTCFLIANTGHASDSASVAFVQQLRSRQLFTLAERHCFDVLRSQTLSDEDRILITIELSRTFVEHASGLPADEADDFYQRADDAFKRLLEQSRLQNASWVIHREQLRTLALKAGHRLRNVAENPLDTEAVQAAVDSANSVEQQIVEQCDSWAKANLKTTAADVIGAFVLNATSQQEAIASLQIERVKNHVLLARLGKLSDVEVGQPLEQNIDILRGLRSGASAQQKWDIGLLLVEIYQLANDLELSEQLLKRLDRNDLPADYQNRLAVLQVKQLMAVGKIADAAQFLIKYRQQHGQLRNELSYLKVKSTVELWRVARTHQNTELADELWQQVTRQVQRAELQSTLFWRVKCLRELQHQGDAARFGEALAQLRHNAQRLHAANRIDDAISAYASLAATAQEMGFGSLASESRHIQASLLYEQEKYAMAIDVLEAIEQASPDDERLAESQMLRAYCLAKLYELEPTPDRLQAYVDQLNQYRRQFRTHRNYDEATWLLSRVEMNSQHWIAACQLLAELIDDQDLGAGARLAFAECLSEIHKAQGEEQAFTIDGKSLSFIQVLKRLADDGDGATDRKQQLSIDRQNGLLKLVKLMLDCSTPDYGWAVKQSTLLLEALEQTDYKTLSDAVANIDEVNKCRLAGRQMQIVALSGDGQFQQAEIALKRLAENNPREALRLLDQLFELSEKLPVEVRVKFVQFQVSTVRHIDRNRVDFTKSELVLLDRVLAKTYEAAGQTQRALSIYRQLLKRTPSDTQLLKKLGALLLECGTNRCLREAQVHWLAIENKSKKGSDDWIDARYHAILCHYRLKNSKDAQKLMRLTELLHPECFEGESKERFALLKIQIEDALSASSTSDK